MNLYALLARALRYAQEYHPAFTDDERTALLAAADHMATLAGSNPIDTTATEKP